jgi:transposase
MAVRNSRSYLNEGQEVFLDGHVRAFEHFGGVPARIRYDSLKAAVEKILKGRERLESERFVAMRSHFPLGDNHAQHCCGQCQ